MHSTRPKLGRNVVALAVVSFLTDVSSELIYPLLPVFLTVTLGASAGMVGVIEGVAESTSALLRLASGWWSDRVKRRKPAIVLGYVVATAMRPLVAIAQSATQVLAIRVTDRVGKGIRTSPRDALIADSVDEQIRGRAYGFHRAMDHAGAFLGPLVAFALLNWAALTMRTVFWLAAVPGALSVLVLVVFVRDRAKPTDARGGVPVVSVGPDSVLDTTRGADVPTRPGEMPRPFWVYLGIVLIFTLGSSTDSFLLLRANQLGVPIALSGILWSAHHAVKSLFSTPGGALSDRLGRIPTMVIGWVVYTLVYFGFAEASTQWHVWGLFLVYGLFYALTEGAERALVADIVPAARRGAAFGWFNLVTGLGALPASIVFGIIWDRAGAHSAFVFGASIAMMASLALIAFATANRGKLGR
ncbi:MAG TPA: MFS transporter [Gemmatimonadaceae bacterium]